MSKYSEFLKNVKETQLTKFFGEVKHTSNKYFKFNHVISDDEIIIVSNNVKFVKGNPVLVIDNNLEGIHFQKRFRRYVLRASRHI